MLRKQTSTYVHNKVEDLVSFLSNGTGVHDRDLFHFRRSVFGSGTGHDHVVQTELLNLQKTVSFPTSL
jgi:hypothetical protein